MNRLRIQTDLVLANVAAAVVMATTAVNWALPFGRFALALACLTLIANVFIVPVMAIKHGYMPSLSGRQKAEIAIGACAIHALARSALGLTGTPWELKAMLIHFAVLPALVALVYLAMIALVLLAGDEIERRVSPRA